MKYLLLILLLGCSGPNYKTICYLDFPQTIKCDEYDLYSYGTRCKIGNMIIYDIPLYCTEVKK